MCSGNAEVLYNYTESASASADAARRLSASSGSSIPRVGAIVISDSTVKLVYNQSATYALPRVARIRVRGIGGDASRTELQSVSKGATFSARG